MVPQQNVLTLDVFLQHPNGKQQFGPHKDRKASAHIQIHPNATHALRGILTSSEWYVIEENDIWRNGLRGSM